MRRSLSVALKILLGGGLLAFLLARVGLTEVLEALRRMEPHFLAAVVAALMVTHLLHAASLRLLTNRSTPSFGAIFKMTLRSWVWGMITPARVGELSLVYYLSRHGMNLGRATALVLLDRLSTLLVIGFVAIGGALWLGIDFPFLGASGGLLVLATTLVALSGWLRFAQSVGPFLPERLRRPWALLSSALRESLYERPVALQGFLLGQVARFLVQCSMPFLLFQAADRPVGYLEVCLVSTFARLAAILPISLNGLGIREGVMVVLFERLFGVPSEVVMAVAIWLNVVLYGSALLAHLLLPPHRQEPHPGLEPDPLPRSLGE